MKIKLITILSYLILCIACKKNADSDNHIILPVGYKIEVIKGNNQTDTIGKTLNDTIIIKITKDGIPQKDCLILFQSQNYGTTNTYYKRTSDSGLTNYLWNLDDAVGTQLLEVILLDSAKAPIDSITIKAQALMPGPGLHRALSAPLSIPTSFCMLQSGRLFSVFDGAEYPHYSDNNGITWKPLKTFSRLHRIKKILATANDELFIAGNKGVFYSNNGGQSWENRSSGLPIIIDNELQNCADMIYTKSGCLIFVSQRNGIFISTDKGKHWRASNTGFPGNFGLDKFSYPAEHPDGTLYIIYDDGLYKSINEGLSWNRVTLSFGMQSLFIDDSGDIISFAGGADLQLVKSEDKGLNWIVIRTYSEPSFNNLNPADIKKYNDYYYFHNPFAGIWITKNLIDYTFISPGSWGFTSFITAKNNNLIIGGSGGLAGIHYYIP